MKTGSTKRLRWAALAIMVASALALIALRVRPSSKAKDAETVHDETREPLSHDEVLATDRAYMALETMLRKQVSDPKVGKQAAQELEPVVTRHPDDVRATFGLAWALDTTGAVERAAPLYTRAAQLAAGRGEVEPQYFAHLYLGSMLLRSGRKAESLAPLETAYGLADKGKPAQTNGPLPGCIGDRAYESMIELGRAYTAVGRHEDAVRVTEEALARRGGDARVWLAAGVARWHAGQRRAADRAFAEAVKRMPDLAPVVEAAKR